MEGTNQGSTSPNASPNSNTVSVSLSSSSNAPSVAAMKPNVATAAAGGEKTSKRVRHRQNLLPNLERAMLVDRLSLTLTIGLMLLTVTTGPWPAILA